MFYFSDILCYNFDNKTINKSASVFSGVGYEYQRYAESI